MSLVIPTYELFIDPILRYLASHPEGAPARDVHEAAAQALNLSDAARQARLPSGAQMVYKHRAGWAHDRLKRAGLSESPRRGYWKLTPQGVEYAAQQRGPLSPAELERLAVVGRGVRLGTTSELSLSDEASASTLAATSTSASPDERLAQALHELRDSVAAELLDSLSRVSPARFEVIVLDLLHNLGYGANRNDLQQVGGSGDGGIDGVISLDKLGLEKVYVQAKRWQSTVGRPELQAFYGALAGQKAKRGVFITTSGFTAQAVGFAKSVEGIVLVDGVKLVHLMMDHEVGVSSRMFKVPKLDSDYFDEDAG